MSKTILRHTLIKKYFSHFCWNAIPLTISITLSSIHFWSCFECLFLLWFNTPYGLSVVQSWTNYFRQSQNKDSSSERIPLNWDNEIFCVINVCNRSWKPNLISWNGNNISKTIYLVREFKDFLVIELLEREFYNFKHLLERW
jgi:hypothetical protein